MTCNNEMVKLDGEKTYILGAKLSSGSKFLLYPFIKVLFQKIKESNEPQIGDCPKARPKQGLHSCETLRIIDCLSRVPRLLSLHCGDEN